MPKIKYLNANNLVSLGVIGYMSGVVSDLRQSMDKQSWTPESKRAVSSAATWLDKAYTAICSQLDPAQGKTLVNRLKSWKGAKFDVIRPSIGAGKRSAELQELIKDDFYDIIEHCMTGACRGCLGIPDCKIKQIFLRYDVPVFDQCDERCPYRYREAKGA